ncbi:MAG: hypothetical protein ACI85F_002884 [Bacteroidia bacterium]|jgi:hypothetical protein
MACGFGIDLDAIDTSFSTSLTKMAIGTMMASFLGPLAIPIIKNMIPPQHTSKKSPTLRAPPFQGGTVAIPPF